MKYFIKTFGCQANEADSEKLASFFDSQGYKVTDDVKLANVVVINSCSVRESAENRVFGLVNNLSKKKGKKQKVIVTGCMVGSALGERKRYSLSFLKRKLPFVDEFKTIEQIIGKDKILPKYQKTDSALVPIMEGCNNFCSYCVVPYARGKEVSRCFDEVICEVKRLVDLGYKQVTLIGQNVNSYGQDLKPKKGFADLLKTIHQIDEIKKISFLTSNPWDLTDQIIKAISLPKVDHYLHLPLQSGDDQILKKMNRPYKSSDYLKLVKKIKKLIPNVKIGTDIIVGFPTETKKQFEDTLKICKEVGFDRAFVSKYSPRMGTAAYHLKDDVPPQEKKRRWNILNDLIN